MAKQYLIRFINWLASRYATEIFWQFDQDEAQGTVQIIKSGYGAYLNFPELFGPASAVVLADLFYRSPEGNGIHSDNPWAVHVYGQETIDDDPVHTEFYLKETQNDQ